MQWIPKKKLYSTLNMALRAGPSLCRKYILQTLAQLTKLQPVLGKDPMHENHIAVMKALWIEKQPKDFQTFRTSIDTRAFVLTLCDESLRMTDTHNVNKAICDYLEEIKIFENDRHVDALALRAADFFPNLKGTHIFVLPQSRQLEGSKTMMEILGALALSVVQQAPLPVDLLRTQAQQTKLEF